MTRNDVFISALLTAIALLPTSAKADVLDVCDIERGFSYREESGYSSDNPFISFRSDSSGSKIFLVYLDPALTKTELMGPVANIRGIKVGSSAFTWIDAVAREAKAVQISFGPVTGGATGFVTIRRAPAGTCPP